MSTDPVLNKTLGAKINKIRKEHNMTREMLAEKIDVSTRFLADVEAGKVGISLSTLISICRALGVSSDYLLDLVCERDCSSLETRIRQITPDYLPYLERLISTFSEAIIHKES